MRIYVGGSLDNVSDDPHLCPDFVAKLGIEIVKQGHVLLNGCRSTFDEEIAKAASEYALKNKRLDDLAERPSSQVISYILKSEKPIHNYGVVRKSSLTTWKMNQPELYVPEQIRTADATLFVAGTNGTFWARNWARYAGKPIFGIPRFGGSGQKIYEQEFQGFRNAQADTYERLNQMSPDMAHYAQEVIAVVEHMLKPCSVFLVMSFKEEYDELYMMFKGICNRFGFSADRTKESSSLVRITQQIEAGIRQSSFVIADVSELSPNVFYEVGFAKAIDKDVILIAREGTKLPFDVYDLKAIFWKKPEDLKSELEPFMCKMAEKHGK